jgi:tetratricopeptide (TPR) repeat protein
MEQNEHLRLILERQTAAIEKIERHFAPAEVEQQERRWRIFIAKMVAVGSIAMSGLFGGWEVIQYMKQQWDIRHMAARYAQVAEEVYYTENNAEVASEFLSKAIELQENNAAYRYLQAYIEGMGVVRSLMNLDRPLSKEEVDMAHEAVARAVLLKRLSADRPEPYILQGQVYAALGENSRAFDELNQAIKLDPRNDFAHVRLAVLLAAEKKVDEALAELDKALGLNTKSKWALLWKGVVLADHRKDWDGARKSYSQALELDPRFDLAYYNLGWTYIKQEPSDYAQARAQFEKAMTINPNFKEAYYGMGMVYGYQDQYEIAQLYFSKAIDIDKAFLTAWKWRGIVQAEQNRPMAALNDFSKAIELAPTQPELYVRRARAYEKLQQADKAVADLRFAAELDPKDKQTWLYLGDVFLNVNEAQMALDNYKKALELDPNYAEAYAQSAQADIKNKDLAAAEQAFEKAIAVATYRPERFLMQRGKFHEDTGAPEKALADYRAARDASPANADAWFAETKILQQLQRKDEALTALGKYIELRPTDKSAQDLRDTIAK